MRQFRPATDPAVAADGISPADAGRQSSHVTPTSHTRPPVEVEADAAQARKEPRSQVVAAERLEQAMQAFRTLRQRRRTASEQDIAVDRLVEKNGQGTLQEHLGRHPT